MPLVCSSTSLPRPDERQPTSANFARARAGHATPEEYRSGGNGFLICGTEEKDHRKRGTLLLWGSRFD